MESSSAARVNRLLGHPASFITTGLLLVVIFGWTFVANPGRPAPADDPAYYHWQTETLLEHDGRSLLEIDGPLDMYSRGYRVLTPVLAGMMRRVGGMGPFTPAIVIVVASKILVPLLLAGLAYRWRREPLIWHAVAISAASLMAAPPFAGYVDNGLSLLLVGASLLLIGPARDSWAATTGLALLLMAAGFTHPTTLAIFGLTVGLMMTLRVLRGPVRPTDALREEGRFLLVAAIVALATYLSWTSGIWGHQASLTEAAIPPPAGPGFFRERLGDWFSALRPIVNLPLFLVGAVGVAANGIGSTERGFPPILLFWLAPLIGLLGAFTGFAYPYYRFFNATAAWMLLIGVGTYFAIRFCFDAADRGRSKRLAIVVVPVLGLLLAGNFVTGLSRTGWNDPDDGWIKPHEIAQLERVRSRLGSSEDPIVFVADAAGMDDIHTYSFLKRTGNVSRYGVPGHLQNRTSVFLGALEDLERGRASGVGYHRHLSQASLEHTQSVIGGGPAQHLVLEAFNQSGSNVSEVGGGLSGAPTSPTIHEEGEWLPEVLLRGCLLLIPGLLLFKRMVPNGGWTEGVVLVPILSVAWVSLLAILVLAVTRGPLTSWTAWSTWMLASLSSAIVYATRSRTAPR